MVDDGWGDYHDATRGDPPRDLLIRAASRLDVIGRVLDLGCGAGNDTRHLLSLGHVVTAIDGHRGAIDALSALCEPRLTCICGTFVEAPFEPGTFDLVSAQLALPFNPPETFDAMFARLLTALAPGGYLACDLFGVDDAWNTPGSGMTFHTRAEVEHLLQPLDVIEMEELRETVRLASGENHEAHAFEIIARRP
jgi:tellurite methyltransferase